MARDLRWHFRALHERFGPQHWWPARTRLEIIVGAILAQNTSWKNVEIALSRLRNSHGLSLPSIRSIPEGTLARLIRPAGFFRAKAATIRDFLRWLDARCEGSLHKLFAMPPELARKELLSLRGIGPETADAILLYAGKHPYFVADAYTRRVLSRHSLIPMEADYSNAQTFIHSHLKRDYLLYNEYHALLVEVGKRYCVKSAPKCCDCPLQRFLPVVPSPS